MESPAALRAEVLGRYATQLSWRVRPAAERVSTGIAELDVPRGAITEIHGPASSGRTSLLLSILSAAARRGEVCALVDADDRLDPAAAAAAAGAELSRLLWVRCGGNAEHALKAVDMLINAGGFGLIVLDLGEVAPGIARRIPLAAWFRLRRALENTPAMLVVLEREQTVKSCASLVIEMRREAVAWSGAPGCSRLLRGLRLEAAPREAAARPKPAGWERRIEFETRAIG
jgi:recombination protein RecA